MGEKKQTYGLSQTRLLYTFKLNGHIIRGIGQIKANWLHPPNCGGTKTIKQSLLKL